MAEGSIDIFTGRLHLCCHAVTVATAAAAAVSAAAASTTASTVIFAAIRTTGQIFLFTMTHYILCVFWQFGNE
eukprot:5810605-Ditylum_brightwellii.AAC.1